MPYLAINGFEILVADGSMSVSREDLSSWNRTGGLTYEGATYRNLRTWEFETDYYTAAEAETVTGWIEGRGSMWNFERYDNLAASTRFSNFSTESGYAFSVGGVFTTSYTARYGQYAGALHSAKYASVSAQFVATTPKWSFQAWKHVSGNSFQLLTAINDTSATQYFVAGTATSAFGSAASSWFAASGASGGRVLFTVRGVDYGILPGTTYYDNIRIFPYAVFTTMMAVTATRSFSEPALPYVELSGNVLDGDTSRTVTVKGFVSSTDPEQGTKYGTFQPLYRLKVRLVER